MVRSTGWSTPLDKKLTVRQIVLFGMLGALIFAAKYVMAFLPNIEPVSLMVMLCAVVFGRKAVYPIALYVVMEFMFYGLGLWNINYLYIWAILAIAAGQMRKVQGALPWAILSGTFGLLFGALCAPVDVVIGGFGYAIAKWVSGIPFDVAHCVGNFAIALVMFVPMRSLLEKLYAKLER